jgi:Protein of unknown function (DUF1573)
MRMRICVFLLLLAVAARGELRWDQLAQTFDAKITDREIIAKYRFSNAGETPITIQDVKTSCGCTTTALAKRTYKPGESGEIEARFEFQGRTGRQEKTIMVLTTEEPKKPDVLRLTVNIPELVDIEPSLVLWRVGEAAEPKVIHVRVNDDIAARVLSVQADNPAIQVNVKEVRPGKELEVSILPRDLSQRAGATLMIRTDYPPENPQMHYAYVRVK